MINANELRINSYYKAGIEFKGSIEAKLLLTEPDRIFKLDTKNIQLILGIDLIAFVNPIPLTEDILLKCGWKYYNGCSSGDMCFDTDCKMDIDYVGGKMKIKSHYQSYVFYKDLNIIHLHHLQNFIFALTGQELNVKL